MSELTEQQLTQCAAIKAAIKRSGRSQAFIARIVWPNLRSDHDKRNRMNAICNGRSKPTEKVYAVLESLNIYMERSRS